MELASLRVTELTSVTRLNNTPEHEIRERKNRQRWAIALKRVGRTVYRSAGETVVSDAWHPVVLPRGSSYTWECQEAGECLIVEFECAVEDTHLHTYTLGDSGAIPRLFDAMERRRIARTPLGDLRNMRDLLAILILLAEAEESTYLPSARQEILRPALDYMTEHYADAQITNESLAALCSISTVYFRKLFRQYCGVSPIRYLHDLRMERAKELLLSDYSSVAQIAESVGYNSLYHFSKMFKSMTGCSPSSFRG